MKAKVLPSNNIYATFHGLLTSLVLVCCFLLIKNIAYGQIGIFRIFNFIILAGGIYISIKGYTKAYKSDRQKLYKLATIISLIAVGSFTFFVLLYLNVFNPTFMNWLSENSNTEVYSSSHKLVLTIALEGFGAAFAASFISTRYHN